VSTRFDARNSSVDSGLDPPHGFGNCECFCQTQRAQDANRFGPGQRFTKKWFGI
jgi:hypothetical protein